MINNSIEIFAMPVFNLFGRKKIEDIKKVKIETMKTGILITGTIKKNDLPKNNNDCNDKNKNSDRKKSMHEYLKIDSNNALLCTVNLGKFIDENKYILDAIKNSNRLVEIERINASRLNDNEKIQNDDALNFNFSNALNYYKNSTLKRLLKHWINTCGIHEINLNDKDSNEFTLFPEDIFEILNFCFSFYKDIYKKFEEGSLEKIEFKVSYEFKFNRKNNSLSNCIESLYDFLVFSLISIFKEKNIRICEYCGMFFVGSKKKKCCSSRCKDLKNNKYEKRKARELKKKEEKNDSIN